VAGDDEALADVERQRLRALVRADVEQANELHAADFRLVTPAGDSLSKEEYLGAVASGAINYVAWSPDAIDARVGADAGCLRYQSTIEIVVDGRALPATRCWHTDYYERRDGRWQVVWSQATAIASANEPSETHDP
jgi:Domain of unknown function (DUF4440)